MLSYKAQVAFESGTCDVHRNLSAALTTTHHVEQGMCPRTLCLHPSSHLCQPQWRRNEKEVYSSGSDGEGGS